MFSLLLNLLSDNYSSNSYTLLYNCYTLLYNSSIIFSNFYICYSFSYTYCILNSNTANNFLCSSYNYLFSLINISFLLICSSNNDVSTLLDFYSKLSHPYIIIFYLSIYNVVFSKMSVNSNTSTGFLAQIS